MPSGASSPHIWPVLNFFPHLANFLSFLLVCRLYFLLRRRKRPSPRRTSGAQPCALGVFLGSGGHTTESIALISSLDFTRYSPRIYFVSTGDRLSAKKAIVLESEKAVEYLSSSSPGPVPQTPYSILNIPRARRVHQSPWTTPFTAVRSLAACLYYTTMAPFISQSVLPEVLILNGPGTCCMLCIAAYFNRLIGIRSPKLVYVESFARVESLSLSGRLLRPFVDRFIVQWPGLARKYPGTEYLGWLV